MHNKPRFIKENAMKNETNDYTHIAEQIAATVEFTVKAMCPTAETAKAFNLQGVVLPDTTFPELLGDKFEDENFFAEINENLRKKSGMVLMTNEKTQKARVLPLKVYLMMMVMHSDLNTFKNIREEIQLKLTELENTFGSVPKEVLEEAYVEMVEKITLSFLKERYNGKTGTISAQKTPPTEKWC
jgi:hypothetical protein